MEYFLTDQQKELKSLARRIAEERVLPVRAELDEKELFPKEILKGVMTERLGLSVSGKPTSEIHYDVRV